MEFNPKLVIFHDDQNDRFRKLCLTLSVSLTFFLTCPIEPFHSGLTLLSRSGICLAVIALILGRRIRALRWQSFVTPTLLLLALMAISQLQETSAYSQENLLAFAVLFIIATTLVSSLPMQSIVSGIAIGGAILATYIVLVAVFRPERAWTGTHLVGPFLGWNNLALTLIFCVPAVLAMNTIRRQFVFILAKFFLIFIIAVEVFATGSVSSVVVFSLLMFVYVTFVAFKRGLTFGWLAGVVGGVIITFLFMNVSQLLLLLGKDPALSGRVPIWLSVIESMGNHWASGFGWTPQFGYNSQVAVTIKSSTGYFQMHTHNDLLQWTATTGVLGAALVLATLLFLIFRSVKGNILNSDLSDIWLWLGPLGLLAGGIAEISVSYATGWFIFCLLAGTVTLWKSENRTMKAVVR